MGKGDKKTKRGKIFRKTYGNTRRKNKLLKIQNKMDSKSKIDEIGRLYLSQGVINNIIVSCKQKLQQEIDVKQIKDLESRIEIHSLQLKSIDDRVNVLRGAFFQFSVEELYAMYGRYDKFISIEFHPNSESNLKFGKSIMGTLLFNRRQRQDLNNDLELESIPRTNGYVKINPSELSNLIDDQIYQLRAKGFLSGDIFEINHTGIEHNDRYKDKSVKEIPGTVNIEIDPSGYNPDLMGLYYYEQTIKTNTKPLIESEWDRYYAFKILYRQTEITKNEWVEKIYEPNSDVIKERIRHYILRSKIGRQIDLSVEEQKDWILSFFKREKERNKLVDKEINRSANKKLKEIIEGNESTILELKRIAYFYEEENLSPFGAKHAVYLDLERYLHIFIRHFSDFQIGDWKEGKSSFQYNFNDTNRLIKIAIEELQSKIDEAIDNGREFKIFDMKAFDFNGNFYAIHIDKNGRLLAFYPHENE